MHSTFFIRTLLERKIVKTLRASIIHKILIGDTIHNIVAPTRIVKMNNYTCI